LALDPGCEFLIIKDEREGLQAELLGCIKVVYAYESACQGAKAFGCRISRLHDHRCVAATGVTDDRQPGRDKTLVISVGDFERGEVPVTVTVFRIDFLPAFLPNGPTQLDECFSIRRTVRGAWDRPLAFRRVQLLQELLQSLLALVPEDFQCL